MNTSLEKIGYFNTIIDPYNGITIESCDLPKTIEEFEVNLDILVCEVQNRRNLIWIYIDIKRSDFIPIATAKGFVFHSCDKDYILLVKRLKDDSVIPACADHTLGVGVVVINDKNELLVIKERVLNLGYKLPGGYVDKAEMISTAVKREVFEETGVVVEFESIISLGHFYPHQFHKSNLYVLCKATPKTLEINIQDTHEVIDAKWVDVNLYLKDEKVLPYSKRIVIAALENSGLKRIDQQVLSHIKRDFELFF